MFIHGKQVLLANSCPEDINHGVYVERLSEHSVWSASDAFHVVWKAAHVFPSLFVHATCYLDDKIQTPHQMSPREQQTPPLQCTQLCGDMMVVSTCADLKQVYELIIASPFNKNPR